MKFTLIFPTGEPDDLSIGMVFIPCAAWVDGRKTLLIPNPSTPHYERGYLRMLINLPTVASRLLLSQKWLVVVIHHVGHGSPQDLAKLLQDCEGEGYSVRLVNQTPQT